MRVSESFLQHNSVHTTSFSYIQYKQHFNQAHYVKVGKYKQAKKPMAVSK